MGSEQWSITEEKEILFKKEKKIGSWRIFEEKEFLRILHLQKEYPVWNEISKLLKKVNIIKSAKRCYLKWYNNKEKNKSYIMKWDIKTNYNTWSNFEEKELLRILHLQKEYPDWDEISKLLNKANIDKSSIQCYYKWYNNKEKKEFNTCKFNVKKKKNY